MKNKTEANWEPGFKGINFLATQNQPGIMPKYNLYEIAVPYDEERDRWTFRNPDGVKSETPSMVPQVQKEKALPVRAEKGPQAQRRFWLKFFGQKA